MYQSPLELEAEKTPYTIARIGNYTLEMAIGGDCKAIIIQSFSVMEMGLVTLNQDILAMACKCCFCNHDVGRSVCHGFKSLSLSWAFSDNIPMCGASL